MDRSRSLRCPRPARLVRTVTGLLVGAVAASGLVSGAPAGAASTGTLRLAAQEEPSCVDWIATCAGLSWGNWTLGVLSLPQAFRVSTAGEYVPGPILAGEPTVEAGPPARITYRIRPEAVWSDGQPITSKDFEYLWKQITTGRDVYDATGYDSISAIDTTDPKTAVVTFSKPFAGWHDLFGGFYYLLPSHLLEGKDRHRVMKDGYAFSGGPYRLQGGAKGWAKGRSMTLVPNPRWWGTAPSIGTVIFQFIPDSSAEVQALKSRQVLAGYPMPQTGMLTQFDKAGLTSSVGYGNQYEALWVNAAQFPLDSKAVRQALLYATDRQAIVDQVLKPTVRQSAVLQSFNVPTFPEYYTPAFERYAPSSAKVDSVMRADGWTRGGDGIWAKGSRRAEFEAVTTAGNKTRELTLQIWQSQLRQAGFAMKTRFLSPDVLFGRTLPAGDYDISLYTSVGTPDPGLCTIFCSANIPSKANDLTGQNWTRLVSPALDVPLGQVDTLLDPGARQSAARQAQTVMADEAISIPLYQQPTIFVWDAARIGGPLRDNTVEGPFWNLELWTLK